MSSAALPHLHFPRKEAAERKKIPASEGGVADSAEEATAAAQSAAAASTGAAAVAASSSSAPTASPAASGGFSFSLANKGPKKPAASVLAALSKANRPSASESDGGARQAVTGSLNASSLAASHKQAQEGGNLGGKGLVIPLIKQTQWRGQPPAAAASASHLQPSLNSAAGVAALKARDGGAAAGISFESEQDLLDSAYAAKQAARAEARAKAAEAASSAAAAPAEEELPALQSVDVAMSLDEQAASALLDDAAAGPAVSNGPSMPSAEQQEAFERAAPILVQNALPGNRANMSEEERLALDVDLRPEEASLEAYERVPISEFGAGMLRGMGWGGLGDPIGGINKAVCEPVQFAPRGERMGLGAQFAKAKHNRAPKQFIKPGEKREATGLQRTSDAAAAAHMASNAADLKAKSLRSLGSRLIQVHSQQLRDGALVEVMDGAYRRSYGRIVRFSDPAEHAHVDDVPISVKLNIGGETVELLRGQVELLDERAMPDDHPAFEDREKRDRRLAKEAAASAAALNRDGRSEEKEASAGSKRGRSERDDADGAASTSKRARDNGSSSRHDERDRERERSRDRRTRSRSRERRERDRHASSSRHSSSHHSAAASSSSAAAASASSSSSSSSAGPPRWVRPHIRVRIVSSSYAGGTWYKLKGTVLDVPSAENVLVRPDGGNGRVLDGLSERQLESVIPSAGTARVMLLRGPHKGCVGQLLQKQTERQKAVVQMEEDLNIVTVDFDDISEYVA